MLDRQLFIAEMMAAGTWERGKTSATLAAEWGLSKSTVENYSAEASRLAKLIAAPYARLRLARALDRGMRVAEDELEAAEAGAGRCPECGRADLDAVKALPAVANSYRDLTGAGAPTKHELSGPGGGPIPVAAAFEIVAASREWTTFMRVLAERHPAALADAASALEPVMQGAPLLEANVEAERRPR